jgi:hypothetical protein
MLPEVHLQVLELAAKILLHNSGDAPVCEPVKLALESIIAGQQWHAIFQSGSAFPEIKKRFNCFSVLRCKCVAHPNPNWSEPFSPDPDPNFSLRFRFGSGSGHFQILVNKQLSVCSYRYFIINRIFFVYQINLVRKCSDGQKCTNWWYIIFRLDPNPNLSHTGPDAQHC